MGQLKSKFLFGSAAPVKILPKTIDVVKAVDDLEDTQDEEYKELNDYKMLKERNSQWRSELGYD